MSAWIRMISEDEAGATLLEALDKAKTPHGTVDNVLRIHSLRPSTMKGHMALYKAVLHDSNNTVPTWFQETVGSYVSMLNECEYSISNHWSNAEYLINNQERSKEIHNALLNNSPETAFCGAELALLRYAEKLTIQPNRLTKHDVEHLLALGVDDAEILEINQIVCYFNYVNRVINGLGVSLDGDTIGFYKESKEK